MNWEDKFDDENLKSGWLLYKNDKIRSKTKRGNTFTVKLRDYYNSTVTVTKDGENYTATCNCWDYNYSKQCPHAVAALYAVTLQPEDPPVSQRCRILPFSEVAKLKNEYHYFNIEKITEKLSILKYVYQQAENLLSEGQMKGDISLFSYHDQEYHSFNGLRISAHETGNSRFPGSVSLRVGKDFFWDATCNYKRCYCSIQYQDVNTRGGGASICKHIAAALILLNQYITEENPGDATDFVGQQFLGRFRKNQNASSEKIANIVLEPELQNDDGVLNARFKIGIGKLYTVKNLTELVENVQNNETLSLGKNGAINFALNDFEEGSRLFYEFIRSRVRDNLQRNERVLARMKWGYHDKSAVEKITDTIPLDGSSIDDFYYLCCDRNELNYVHKLLDKSCTKGKVTCAEGRPQLHLVIRDIREDDQIAGINVSGRLPEFCQGAQALYFTDDKFLYRMPADDYEKYQSLMDLSDNLGGFSFNIGRRSLGEFYHSVYPVLKEIAVIDDRARNQIESIIPPVPETVFYLDSIDGILYCRAETSYGEKKHSPMEAGTHRGYPHIYRDYAKEREIYNTVKEFFPLYDALRDESSCEESEECYRVYREGVDALLKLGEIQCTDSFRNRKIRKNTGIKVGVSVESDLLNLEITSQDVSREELLAIFDNYRRKRKYFVLSNGDFVNLEEPDIALLSEIMSSCGTDLKNLSGDRLQFPMYRALYLDNLLQDHEELYSHRDRNFRKLIKDFGMIKDSDLEIPQFLENTLRSYQVFGHRWLRTLLHNHFGGILADEMGLGKTLQIISVLSAEKDDTPRTALIVCPASLVYNWKEEFLRFAPELKVEAVACGARERHAQIQNYQQADVLITSYDLLKRDMTQYENCFFEYQILDEAQYIKNPKTVAAKTVKVIHAAHRFALTGTPIENRLSELWSIFDFLMPGFLYDYETFRREFELPITKDKDAEASSRLKKMISPFILRRLKTDVLKDLPDKIEELRYAVMEETQRKLYDAHVLHISKQVEKEDAAEFSRNKLKLLAEITRVRQLCCDPALVVENYSGESAKRKACIELIQSAIEGEHRILLFSQFTSMLELLSEDLKRENIPFYQLTGETPKEERIRLMNSFNEDDTPVFLISLKAGGTGLNLTGADVVIHYDPWWNLAVQNQATDRAHRIGQTRNVTVYKLITKDSIEEKIVKMQETKKNLADEILSGENGTLASLSKEDLLELLS